MTELMWCLGAVKPFKVIHAPSCRYARRPYSFFNGMTEEQIAQALFRNSSWEWHKGCALCTPRLTRELNEARRREYLRRRAR